jgi:hypothetical protein
MTPVMIQKATAVWWATWCPLMVVCRMTASLVVLVAV